VCDLTVVPSTILVLVPAATVGLEGATLAAGASRGCLAPGRFVAWPFVVAAGDPYFGHLERLASAAGFQRDVAAFTQPLLAIRTPEWKLVLRGGGAPSLYDVRADPDEIHDLLESGAGEVDELSRALEAWRGSTEPYSGETGGGSGSPLSPEARERLRRLGYTGRDD
jgi:hypothetical protein